MDTDTPKPGDNRLRGIDPEKLLLVEPEEIAPLLELQYTGLAERAKELNLRAAIWLDTHMASPGIYEVKDEADNNRLTDLYRQIKDHAGVDGEVDTARKKVKLGPFRAIQAIDAHFGNLRTDLVYWMETVTKAQQDFMRREMQRKTREREEAAQKAREDAARLIAEARKTQDEATIEKAIEADDRAALAEERAAAPMADITRTRSTLGNTTSGSLTWTFEVTDLKALCAAVAKGEAPVTFIQANESAIRAAVRPKNGMRDIPGVRIFEDVKLNRRGA